MPHHKSAKKRVRGNETKRQNNRRYMSAVKTAVKNFRTALDGLYEGATEVGAVRTLFTNAQQMLAKARGKGILHSNTVDRKISRLNKLMEKTVVEAAQEDKPAIKKTAAKKKAAAKKKTAKKK